MFPNFESELIWGRWVRRIAQSLVVLLCVWLFENPARGQTVEEVLCGLQERRLIFAGSEKDLIQWPEGIAYFPRNDSINNLSVTLKALNLASVWFDFIKHQFVNMDVGTMRLINPSVSGGSTVTADYAWGHVDIPSVGKFDEGNWRGKLVQLASNIDQLRAVEQLLWRNGSTHFERFSESDATAAKSFNFNWPSFTPRDSDKSENFTYPTGKVEGGVARFGGPSYNPIWAGWMSPNYKMSETSVFSWTGFGASSTSYKQVNDDDADFKYSTSAYASATGTLGFRTQLKVRPNINVPVNAPKGWNGKSILYRRANWGNWSVDEFKSWAGNRLNCGWWSPREMQAKAGGVFELGSFNEWVHDDEGGGRKKIGALTEMWSSLQGALDLPSPNIATKKVDSPDADHPGYEEYAVISGTEDRAVGYEIEAFAVGLPDFKPIVPALAKVAAGGVGPVGQVVSRTNPNDPVWVDVGRGKEDRNQRGWIGFGLRGGIWSLIFHGAGSQFDVLYEENSSEFGDQPIGGKSFGPIENDNTDWEKGGFFGGTGPIGVPEPHAEYLLSWLAPRLRQVRGSDVLVNIRQVSPYVKEVTFYWAGELAPSTQGFYSTAGLAPFKTMVFSNPTVQGVFATDHHHFRIVEDGKVFHEIVVKKRNPDSLGPEDWVVKFTHSTGPSAESEETSRIVSVPKDDATHPWTFVEKDGSVSRKTRCLWLRNPMDYEIPILKKMEQGSGQEMRTTTYDQTLTSEGAYRLNRIEFTGDTNWSENGRVLEYDGNEVLTADSRTVGGKTLKQQNAYGNGSVTRTWTLNGQQFRQRREIFTSGFSRVQFSENGQSAGSVEYHGNSTGGIPHTPKGSVSAAGYTQSFQAAKTAGGEGLQIDVKAGWGSGFSAGTKTTTKLNSYGELISKNVSTTDGVALSKTEATSWTGWGAPKTMQNLRGEETTIVYNETGSAWGTTRSVTGPDGVRRENTTLDWRNRPTSINAGHETITQNYDNPLVDSWNSDSGRSMVRQYSASGELKSGNSNSGIESSFNIDPVGGSSVTVDGRTVPMTIDASGIMSSRGNGLGSRGSEQSFGVEGGKFYVETTEMMKQGGESNFKVRAYYDGRGRLVKVTRPGVQGQGLVEESWLYDDANRSVTHNPVPGGSAEAVTTTTSADGKTTTITKGGTPYLRIERGTSGGSVTETTTLLSGNIPIKKVEINPSLGKQTITPMGWSGNAITVTESVAKTTYQNNLTGDSLTMNRASGLLTGITGTLNGVPLNMSNVDHDHGQLRGISGTIGGAASGFSLDAAQRMTGLWGAGFSKGISYSAPGGGYKMSIQDSVQGTGFEMVVDAVADPVSVAGDGIQAMQFSVGDTATGRETAVNGSVTMQSNFYGDVNRKDYTGGISELYTRDGDGSIKRVDVGGPQGPATSAIVESNTSQRKVINYGGGYTVDEQFYIFGSRQSVTAPHDNRTFAYDRFKPRTEVHGAGDLWNGAKVEWIPDASGRPGRLSVTGPGFGRIFDLQYFGGDRLSSTTTTGAKAVYTSNTTTGRLGTLTRGDLVTTWDYDEQTGLLKSVSNAGGAGLNLNYDYWPYGSKQRLKQRTASSGVSWANMAYDGNGGLTKAETNGSRTFEYAYDGRGNRIGAQGTSGATYSANGLDQLTGRSLASRGFGIYGTVDPATQLQITHPYLPSSGPAFSFNLATGEFSGFYTVPPTANNGGPLAVEALVKGTLPGVSGGADVVAEEKLRLMVPPVAEALLHDGAGRLEEDAWWNYTWDGAGRLRTMVRKPGAYPLADQTGEQVDFIYDADGRRIQKTHTTTLTVNGQAQVSIEESNVLWSNWLPVLEIRKKNGQNLGRRWFQWGADLSGTMEGSGGIGGLTAILEEGPGGQLLRTLLPVQDGLGNITAVINAANGDTVAFYDFGPYGEPLGERGETDACPFRWQTKWYDTESQHYYFGYRYYDPKHGRWLSRDPMGEAGGFNLYAYCGNDPVNRHDPLGLAWGDTALIDGGWAPLGDPYSDPAGNVMVKMRHVIALTLDGRMNVASDSVMSLAAGKRLAPYSSVWRQPMATPQPTLLAGTGFQGVDFADISNYIENHPGWNAQLGVMEGGLYGLGGGYVFGGIRAVIGARAAGYLGSGLLGMGLGEWASNDFAVNPRTAGQMLGGLPTGGVFLGAGERHGAALAELFTPQRLTLGGGMLRLNASEAGSVLNPFAELFGDSPAIGMSIRDSIPGMRTPALHHIATDKDANFALRFGQLFSDAGMDLQHPLNKILLGDHIGPHGYYNRIILGRLEGAVVGIPRGTSQFRANLIGELFRIRGELADPMNPLRGLLNTPASAGEIWLSQP